MLKSHSKPSMQPDNSGAGTRVLVTGANGFIGVRVVARLLKMGTNHVVCLVRPTSNIERLTRLIQDHDPSHVSIIRGDLMSPEVCRLAVRDCSVVYHLAAGVEKSFAGAFMNSALATRNLLDAITEREILPRFVNVSSFAVYSTLNLKRGALLDESCPLETEHRLRNDPYAFGKIKQEEIVREYESLHHVPTVILRPGSVFGPGKLGVSGRVGIDTFGIFLYLGGRNILPLTYVDNCADAIVLAGIAPGVEGGAFNVVDDDLITSCEFFAAYRGNRGYFRYIWIPHWLSYYGCRLWERYARVSHGQLPPVFNIRRWSAEWKGHTYSNRLLKQATGWTPSVAMPAALRLFLAQFEKGAANQ